jgi:hypothetical protein
MYIRKSHWLGDTICAIVVLAAQLAMVAIGLLPLILL